MGQVKDIAHTPAVRLGASQLYELQDWVAGDREDKLIRVIEHAQRQEPPNERLIGACGAFAMAEMDENGETPELLEVVRMAFPDAYSVER